ncbi:MAG: dodecin family protein, partial [Caulobacterales bacterium]|nr:dodecin family protein [Caulobacterales bacterium]
RARRHRPVIISRPMSAPRRLHARLSTAHTARPSGERASARLRKSTWEEAVPESVYKIVELVGTSTESWEKAAVAAIDRAASSLRDLRIAEVTAQDLVIENGGVTAFRTKLKVSFKYEGD